MGLLPIALAVDGNGTFLEDLSRLLGRMNLEVLPVDNALEALEIARVAHPQFIIMAMALPDMDSLEVLRIFRRDKDLASVPVIMTTELEDKTRQWEALSLGCIDILVKPVALRSLHKAIQRCNVFPGGGRRYLRVPFVTSVGLHCQGRLFQASSVTLSERGIFVHMSEALQKGAHVDIDLPLTSGKVCHVGGYVIYCGAENDGAKADTASLAIKFDRLTLKSKKLIADMVAELLIGDIVSQQPDHFVKPK